MTNEQALTILKAAIDEAVKKGVFQNIDSIQSIILAFGYIHTELNKKETKK
jgi:hypothetical protein